MISQERTMTSTPQPTTKKKTACNENLFLKTLSVKSLKGLEEYFKIAFTIYYHASVTQIKIIFTYFWKLLYCCITYSFRFRKRFQNFNT